MRFSGSMFVRFSFLLMLLVVGQDVMAHGVGDADKATMVDGGLIDYIRLGAVHMLTGYDHLLFLFGVMFFLRHFKDVVAFITAFTVGHCVTLIAATYAGITANAYLIDAVIALTVVYKGFDNIGGFEKVFKRPSPNLLAMVFVFGLIHGFGLSTRLQELPLGDEGLLLRILSFNVGVELGQIVALSGMLLVLTLWRKSSAFEDMSFGSNVLLMVAGVGLFCMQCYGFASEEPHHEPAAVPAVAEPSHESGHGGHSHHGHEHGGHDHHGHEH